MRNRDFVEAARISGEGSWRIILAEIMPNLTAVIASSFLFTTLYAIGTYVGLGFLNVVTAGKHYNWGTILFDATSSSAVESGFWWWYIPPGIAIALLGTSLALINFGIDEYINPRLRMASRPRAKRSASSCARSSASPPSSAGSPPERAAPLTQLEEARDPRRGAGTLHAAQGVGAQ